MASTELAMQSTRNGDHPSVSGPTHEPFMPAPTAAASAATLALEDIDPIETREWVDSFHSLVGYGGVRRGAFILEQLEQHARRIGIDPLRALASPYLNTIPPEQQPAYAGDLELERRISSIIRWNALAMVVRANRAHGELGGHIA
ncbi:MAG: hypothetical protein ACRETY_15005, partial [Steroidobacteraceae bacterium]